MNWRICLASSAVTADFFAPETAGAMIAFSTLRESQTGQLSLPPFDCASNAAESLNQPSNSWALRQRRL